MFKQLFELSYIHVSHHSMAHLVPWPCRQAGVAGPTSAVRIAAVERSRTTVAVYHPKAPRCAVLWEDGGLFGMFPLGPICMLVFMITLVTASPCFSWLFHNIPYIDSGNQSCDIMVKKQLSSSADGYIILYHPCSLLEISPCCRLSSTYSLQRTSWFVNETFSGCGRDATQIGP